MSDTFCPIPWIFQAVRANGDIRVCCQANVTKNKGVIRKEDGTAYNAGVDVLEDARNADFMKTIRSNMLTGKWSEECGRCRSEEETGLNSRRQYEQQNWPKFTKQKAMEQTEFDGSIDINETPVEYYDLRFGNFCNLKCRMCGPTDSDAWYDDWIKLTGKNTFKDTSGEIEIKQIGNKLCATEFDWPNYEPFWEQLEANAQNIKHVYFAGGEPLLIERHYDFLERCIENGSAKQMIVEYNTNMSTLPPRVVKLWESFKQVRVGASVDGMGAVLEYQRHPAKWNKVLKNLQILDNTPPNIMGWLAFTVTAYNVHHMIDFMKWKLTESNFKKINSTKKRPIITNHVAHHPKHLNIRVLPDEMKQHIVNEFNLFIEWCQEADLSENTFNKALDIRNSIVKYMTSDSYYDTHWNEFLKYTQDLDKIRNENLLDAAPIFSEYI